MHLYSVNLEDEADSGPVYLMRVEQLELTRALIEVVMQEDTVAPALALVKITLPSSVD